MSLRIETLNSTLYQWSLTRVPGIDEQSSKLPTIVNVAAEVPGTVQLDLLAHSIIVEPYRNDNEVRQHWVGLSDWQYQTMVQVYVWCVFTKFY